LPEQSASQIKTNHFQKDQFLYKNPVALLLPPKQTNSNAINQSRVEKTRQKVQSIQSESAEAKQSCAIKNHKKQTKKRI